MSEVDTIFSELHVEVLNTGRHFSLLKEFIYSPPEGEAVVAHAGFKTDFASIPRVATIFIPKLGRYTQPAVIHDYLCRKADNWKQRRQGDKVFREAMEVVKVHLVKRWLMYWAVWVAGMIAWGLAKVGIHGRVRKQYDEDERAKKAAQA
jgi:hypothetical protein